jgi:hypothetical protein
VFQQHKLLLETGLGFESDHGELAKARLTKLRVLIALRRGQRWEFSRAALKQLTVIREQHIESNGSDQATGF